MKITVLAGELAKAVNLVGASLPARSPNEGFRLVLLQADEDGIRLVTNNGTYALEYHLSTVLRVTEPGSVAFGMMHLPALLAAQARQDPMAEVTLETSTRMRAADPANGRPVETEQVILRMSVGWMDEFDVPATSGDLVPTFPAAAVPGWLQVAALPLVTILRNGLVATTADNPRFNLAGMVFEPTGSPDQARLLGVGTDGRRLVRTAAQATIIDEPTWPSLDDGAVVPRKALDALLRLAENESGSMPIRVGYSVPLKGTAQFVAECGGFRVRSRVLEGRFPHYHDALAWDAGDLGFLTGQAERLAHSAELAAITAADDEMPRVVLEFDGAGQVLFWSRTETGSGFARAGVPRMVDAPRAFAVRPEYLAAAFRTVPPGCEAEVRFHPRFGLRVTSPDCDCLIVPYNDPIVSAWPAFLGCEPAPEEPRVKPTPPPAEKAPRKKRPRPAASPESPDPGQPAAPFRPEPGGGAPVKLDAAPEPEPEPAPAAPGKRDIVSESVIFD